MNDLVTKKKKKKDSFPVIFKKSLYQKKKKKSNQSILTYIVDQCLVDTCSGNELTEWFESENKDPLG